MPLYTLCTRKFKMTSVCLQGSSLTVPRATAVAEVQSLKSVASRASINRHFSANVSIHVSVPDEGLNVLLSINRPKVGLTPEFSFKLSATTHFTIRKLILPVRTYLRKSVSGKLNCITIKVSLMVLFVEYMSPWWRSIPGPPEPKDLHATSRQGYQWGESGFYGFCFCTKPSLKWNFRQNFHPLLALYQKWMFQSIFHIFFLVIWDLLEDLRGWVGATCWKPTGKRYNPLPSVRLWSHTSKASSDFDRRAEELHTSRRVAGFLRACHLHRWIIFLIWCDDIQLFSTLKTFYWTISYQTFEGQ